MFFKYLLEQSGSGVSFSTLMEKIADVFFDLKSNLRPTEKKNMFKIIRKRLYDALNCQ